MKKLVAGFVAACATMCVVALAGCGPSAVATGDMGGITVSASSETKVVPDMARITVAVNTQAATAEKCQQDNAKAVNDVIDALLAAGVLEENIQTQWTNLNPIQDYRALSSTEPAPAVAVANDAEAEKDTSMIDGSDKATAGGESTENEFSTIVGYEMYTSLSVDGISIDAVGAISSAAVAAGATDVNGIQYYASSYDEAYEAALGQAIEAARKKAQSIADMSGVKLGAIVAVTEGYQDTGYRYANAMDFGVEEDAAGGAMAKTMPGQVDINAQVTVRFAIA